MRRIGRLRRLASPSKVAVIGQPATAPMTSRQPVAELPKSSTSRGSRKPATPTPWTSQAPAPAALDDALDSGAERAHGVCGVEDVLAFKQAGDLRLADRERAEDKRAVGDRLVARHADLAAERPRAPRAQGERRDPNAGLRFPA